MPAYMRATIVERGCAVQQRGVSHCLLLVWTPEGYGISSKRQDWMQGPP